ncbi:MAG: ice-binding family protein [Pseudomonadota bacterium]
MKISDQYRGPMQWTLAVSITAMLVSCGGSGGRDPVLGTGAGMATVVPVTGPGTPVVVPGAGGVPGNPAVATDVSVAFVSPSVDATGICPDAKIGATFDVPSGARIDPTSVNTTTFTLTSGASAPLASSTIAVDSATGRTATFTPASLLTANTTYTATILGGATGVSDLATPANRMASTVTWNFTVGAPGSCQPLISLKTASRYGIFGGTAGMTNSGNQTIITGAGGTTADIGTTATATSSITGFHDSAPSDVYTESVGVNEGSVTGKIYTCTTSTTGPTSASVNAASCTAATNAALDTKAAYDALVALPPGPNPDQGAGSLSNLVLAPGVYKAAGGSFKMEGGDLTLDAQGDPDAVFVFQMASTLTVGGPGAAFPQSVTLVNGAQAKNVFWQVGSAATINLAGGGTMVGTIISQAGVVFSTAGNTAIARLNGRALSTGASVTMVNTIITVPAP